MFSAAYFKPLCHSEDELTPEAIRKEEHQSIHLIKSLNTMLIGLKYVISKQQFNYHYVC